MILNKDNKQVKLKLPDKTQQNIPFNARLLSKRKSAFNNVNKNICNEFSIINSKTSNKNLSSTYITDNIKRMNNIKLIKGKKIKDLFDEDLYFNELEELKKKINNITCLKDLENLKNGKAISSKLKKKYLENINININKHNLNNNISNYKLSIVEDIDSYVNFSKRQTEAILHSKRDILSTVQALISFISLISTILSNECTSLKGSEYIVQNEFSLYMCFLSTIFLIITIVYDNYLKTEIQGINKHIKGKIIRHSLNNYIDIIIEILIFIVTPTPWFIGKKTDIYISRFNIDGYYRINTLFSIFVFFRLWYIVKLWLVQSKFYSPRSARLGRLYGADIHILYSLKCKMTDSPFNSFLILFAIFWIFGTLTVRFFESSIEEITGLNFPVFWNSLWFTIITMTTVGFGDYYPNSTGGRVMSICSCLAAAFLISLSISTFSNLFEFERGEQEICNTINRITMKNNKEELSKKLIRCYIKSMREMKKSKSTYIDSNKTTKSKHNKKVELIQTSQIGNYYVKNSKLNKIKNKLYTNILDLKSKSEEINFSYPPQSNIETFLENFNSIESTVDSLSKKLIDLNYKVSGYTKKYKTLLNIENNIFKN